MNSTQNGESWSKNDFYEWKKDSLKRSVLLSGTSAVSISSVAETMPAAQPRSFTIWMGGWGEHCRGDLAPQSHLWCKKSANALS